MRYAAPLAASVLAAVAWIACWQQVELVRLKHRVVQAQSIAPAPLTTRLVASARAHPLADVSRRPALDQLKTLLVEREQAVADARDAAVDFGIPPTGPEMQQAIALATSDIDRSITKLIGPQAAAQLALVSAAPEPLPEATIPPSAPVAPAPAPIYVNVPPAQVYVVTTPPPAAPEAPATDDASPDPSPAYPVASVLLGGGLGGSYISANPGETHHEPTQLEQLKSLTASAGIPLEGSPLGEIVATNPLLLMKQHAAAGRYSR